MGDNPVNLADLGSQVQSLLVSISEVNAKLKYEEKEMRARSESLQAQLKDLNKREDALVQAHGTVKSVGELLDLKKSADDRIAAAEKKENESAKQIQLAQDGLKAEKETLAQAQSKLERDRSDLEHREKNLTRDMVAFNKEKEDYKAKLKSDFLANVGKNIGV